jgi:hypothetical protein
MHALDKQSPYILLVKRSGHVISGNAIGISCKAQAGKIVENR